MYKIANEQLPSLFAAIAGRMDLYMPLRKNGQVNYGIWSREEETALDALNTVKSPKDFFFPQSENLYTCYREGKKISITPEELADAPFAIFGIRGCDVKGIEVLDTLAAEGFNGIPVALLGLNNPIGIIFSGLFVAYLNQGGFNMQVYGFAPQVIDIIISVVIYFAAFSLLLRGFVERRVKRREEKRAADGRPAVSGRGPQEGGGAE